MIISIDSLYQPHLETQRSHLDQSRIQFYINHTGEIRGVLVYENPLDGERILVNGHHRVESARRLNWAQIDADVRTGTRQDTLSYRDLERRPWSEIENERGQI
jgi:ParB-like nuclease domain